MWLLGICIVVLIVLAWSALLGGGEDIYPTYDDTHPLFGTDDEDDDE